FVDGTRNTIGGATPGAGNVISGNGATAMYFEGSSFPKDRKGVEESQIGTDVTGSNPLAQLGWGIITGNGNVIGGHLPRGGNIISNNYGGIVVSRTGDNDAPNLIQGNSIGTDITGTVDFGNTTRGIYAIGTHNLIGGTTPGAGNLISGNDGEGIYIEVSSFA